MANLMKMIAKAKGLELDEEFNIVGEDISCNPFKITKDGLFDCDNDQRYEHLSDLITGELKIEKLPFKPKIQGIYYLSEITGDSKYSAIIYTNDLFDKRCEERGIMFETSKEAVEQTNITLNDIKTRKGKFL